LQAVHNSVFDPKLTVFTDEAWFHLRGYISAQNNRYWCSINPKQTFEVPLHDQKIGVWCAITASRIVGPIFFFKTLLIQSGMSLTFFGPFLTVLWKKKRHMVILCKMGLQHTATYSIFYLNEVFEDRLISRGLWPARSPDLNPRDFYLWGNLKDKVFSNNPHTLVELKQSIRETVSSIEVSEMKLVSNNIFKRLEACLRAEGSHFEYLL
jgi:hypothetical protein